MTEPPGRRPARRMAEVDAATLAALHAGTMETRTIVEGFVIDFARLLANVRPELAATAAAALDPRHGITRRMVRAGELLLADGGMDAFDDLARHPSDTVRGWAAYLLAAAPGLGLDERLARIRPLALDPHFGVREWAWIALRPRVAAELDAAIVEFSHWVLEPDPFARRFAVEITRPRGVWCAHVGALKDQPALGLPLLEPLSGEPVRYVQDSVANWLNDAAKSRPEWVRGLCGEWLATAPSSPATRYICRRALRSVDRSAAPERA